MYLTIINVIAYFFSALFFIVLIRSKMWKLKNLKALWQNVINDLKTKNLIKKEIAKAEANGEKGFEMPDGTVVYAKTQAGALFKYNQLKNKLKNNSK
jgi:hypothetical protein